ncbi:hypothetical protein NDU88_003768 [Pleurodeles waltl]|uniref:Uncharacterized protein n=1 Tax=Pleurodeles waltl TaxID=8319 RepID=A0AAV7MVJ3_PLEWA|nr:hypothetical protein NDU88_003768 [Pleurodeles waltl]
MRTASSLIVGPTGVGSVNIFASAGEDHVGMTGVGTDPQWIQRGPQWLEPKPLTQYRRGPYPNPQALKEPQRGRSAQR